MMLEISTREKSNSVNIGIIAFLLIGSFLNYYLLWAFSACAILFLVFSRGGRFSFRVMPGAKSYFVFLIVGVSIGVINVASGLRSWWPYCRDIILATQLLLFWIIGCLIGVKYHYNKEYLFRTIFVYVFLYSSISIIQRIVGYLGSQEQSFSDFVSSGIIDQFTVAIGLFITFFKPDCINGFYLSRRFDSVGRLVILASAVLAFSRTLILIFLCLIITMGFRKFKPLLKLGLVGVVLLILVSYFVPSVLTFFIEKIEHSMTEVSSSSTTWTEHDIVWNWRGYEMYCAVEQFNEYDFLTKLFGKGFGQLIDAQGYAKLVTGEDGLAFLHNGYYTSLIKCGFLGVGLYLSFFFECFHFFKHKYITTYERRLVLGIIIAMAVSAYFIGGVFWGGGSLIIYMIFGWVAVDNSNIEEYLLC